VSLISGCVPVSTYSSTFGTWGFPTEACVFGFLSNDGQPGSYSGSEVGLDAPRTTSRTYLRSWNGAHPIQHWRL
jgi:hypothetical protein